MKNFFFRFCLCGVVLTIILFVPDFRTGIHLFTYELPDSYSNDKLLERGDRIREIEDIRLLQEFAVYLCNSKFELEQTIHHTHESLKKVWVSDCLKFCVLCCFFTIGCWRARRRIGRLDENGK